MRNNEKKILVTAALPYVNNVPHLGNLMPIISADIYARSHKIRGHNCIFTCGTDEHGTTAEIKAKEEGITPQELVDKYYKIHKEIYKWFNFDIDCFGRTSDRINHEISQEIFQKIYANNFIIEKELVQMWDEKEQKFLSDRFIQGICPYCDFEGARGDQCDKCGKLLEPTELINPISSISGTSPIEKETKHLFIDLGKIEHNSELKLDLSNWKSINESKWSKNALNITNAWIKEGLKERCITRDLNWGVKVPYEKINLSDEYKNKVLYSWFDAPIGYISITAQAKNIDGEKQNIDWKDWWKNPDETSLVQFMGKDNTPFHTILFPAFCIAAKDNYTLMNEISVNEYINYEGGKFSKSRQVGVFGDDAIKSGIPADVYKYYLIAMRPEYSDTDFSWTEFQNKVNKELIGNLGNYVNRVLTFVSRMGGVIYDSKENGNFTNFDLGEIAGVKSDGIKSFENQGQLIFENIDNFKIKDALKKIFSISGEGNFYFQKEQPWVSLKEDVEKTRCIIARLARLVKDLAILINPFMPDTSKEIFSQINLDYNVWCKRDMIDEPLPQEHTIQIDKIKPLFTKMEDDFVKKMHDKFSETTIEVNQKPEFPLNLKVAEIENVEEHPDAEKLFVLQINLGSEKRQLVAGLRGHYEKNELVGKKVVMLSNLKPAKLRGVKSEGMILAGEHDGVVKILTSEKDIGSQIEIEGFDIRDTRITIDDVQKNPLSIKNNQVFTKDSIVLKDVTVELKTGKVY